MTQHIPNLERKLDGNLYEIASAQQVQGSYKKNVKPRRKRANILNEKTTKEFRLARKKFFLTFSDVSNSEASKQKLLEFLQSKGRINKCRIGEEPHQNGVPHFHVYVEYAVRIDTIDVRFFDWMGVHPNIANPKSRQDTQRVAEYCMKEGNFIGYGEVQVLCGSHNFLARKRDIEAFNTHCEILQEKDPFPFFLPNDVKVEAPLKSEKKCNYYIQAPSDWGKTHWINLQFDGKKVYLVAEKSRYPFDTYEGQQVVLFNDWIPCLQMIKHISDCWDIRVPVYGDTRYCVRYWPKGQRRVMVILSCADCPYEDCVEFMNRFSIIKI